MNSSGLLGIFPFSKDGIAAASCANWVSSIFIESKLILYSKRKIIQFSIYIFQYLVISMEFLIYTISHSTLTIDKILKERVTITLSTQALRRIIIVIITSLVVGVLIPSLILRTKPVVIIDEVKVLMGLETEIF
jgi:hypothetical protein